MPAASDPHSSLLLPPSNLLDLDTLLPHIGQCLGDDCDDDDDGDDGVDGDESKSEKSLNLSRRGSSRRSGHIGVRHSSNPSLKRVLLNQFFNIQSIDS